MASQKKTQDAGKSSRKNEKKTDNTSADAKKSVKKTAEPEAPRHQRDPSSLINQILPFVFFVCAVIFILVLVMNENAGVVVTFLKRLLLGMFSAAAFSIPAILVLLGVFWLSDIINDRAKLKFWCAGISVLLLSTLMHFIMSGDAVFKLKTLYETGGRYESGGVIGGLLGSLFLKCFGKNVIPYIIVISALFVSILLMFGLTPRSVYVFIAYKIKKRREAVREQKSIEALSPVPKPVIERIRTLDEHKAVTPDENPAREVANRKSRKRFDPDVDISKDKPPVKTAVDEVDQDVIDKKIFDEVMRRTRERYGEQSFENDAEVSVDSPTISYGSEPPHTDTEPGEITAPTETKTENTPSDEFDLSKIFVDPEKIELLRVNNDIEAVSDGGDIIEAEVEMLSSAAGTDIVPPDTAIKEDVPEAPVPVYEFPPLSLLAEPQRSSSADLDELKTNATKLVDTLRSFNVKTRVSDVFHGPTITRYELTPESGTRVRSIANLSEDIALSLAAPGVRIEAPIPGKAAVGVEVPNKKRENVMLRALLENEAFDKAGSRLTAALGMDVAGEPIFCDIAKMPHLLVSGATGMGKSVCLNSIIVSLLYKSTPQEIRLIMIDPKKVELNIYNGIPHLHVPVVSDPKKAAGTLAWAVGEMERRYELIESVGVRNIQNYNEITYNDPEKEFMPQMVIVIDELADLMMTAPDDVEASICRIAQMGRAAGIHLIIGTQRPSVDVITGLIKANIPSRIAFKMASQVDSRTVIDIAGAEKLLGRGDMLYAPVGVMKPVRVQGAYVSEEEVGRITEFLTGICPTPQYDEKAIVGIDEAAARCGQKKGKGGDAESDSADMGGADPMMKQALELAVESGKISTSLIQRRLSLGYGRAAKIIDQMEARGYVGPPDGPRPREVLITRQQYQELVLRDEIE